MSTAANRVAPVVAGFDVGRVREEFPALKQLVHGKPLVYLDNAATTQKPQLVIDAITHFYQEDCSNIHRGVHLLSERATKAYEDARLAVQQFINAADPAEVIFVRGTTEAINLVAHSYGRTHVQAGDAVLISAMEHHSNIVPWQILCEERGARLRVVPMNGRGELLLRQIIAMAHEHGTPVLVDGAQAVPHLQVDVQELDCDFYAFSGHKMYGPTGVGVLYGKKRLLEAMPPYQGGGDMISSVTFEKTTYNRLPFKFEAGTPNIAGVIGLGAAIEYLGRIALERVPVHEHYLLAYATERISSLPGVRLIGTAQEKAAVLSFVLEGVHPHDIGTVLDQEGIAVRTGHHCAQPVMQFFGVPATARASFALYNTEEEVDALMRGICKVQEIFA